MPLTPTKRSIAIVLGCAAATASAEPPKETPLSMVDALHTAFGEHHARAVHTKGVILEGTFTPATEARSIVKTPVFVGGPLPVVARFSLFAGVPDLPDNDDGASPAGFAIKIKAPDGDDFDIEANQHKDFIVATFDEFAIFLRSLAASRASTTHPNPTEQFLAAHPHAKKFLETRTYPASYATATYFGINSEKFTNAQGQSKFIRYRFVPHQSEKYLSPTERKSMSASYLQDEIIQRVSQKPIVFDLIAQLSGPGDKIDDPSIAWPDSRPTVKLGTITLTKLPTDPVSFTRNAHHSLHFYIPNSVFTDLAERSGATFDGELRFRFANPYDDPVVRHLGHAALAMLDQDGSPFALDCLMQSLAAHTLQQYGSSEGALPPTARGLPRRLVRLAQEVMEERLAGDLSVTELADLCGLSASHFSRAFKQATGFSPHRWMQIRRIERAKSLLLRKTASLAQIALTCGFADQSHFTRSFAREVGEPPLRWLRNL